MVPVYVRHSTFRLPKDPSIPIVMIGPGTGLAPFRGFFQDRDYDKHTKGKELGEALLFYGCRAKDQDYLYQDELVGYEKTGVISELNVAFSRETAQKVYVTHLIKQQMEKIWQSFQKE